MSKSNINKQNLQKFNELKETGNPRIREELIVENMYIAESIADSMANKYEIDNEELRQYAYEALIKAVNEFSVDLDIPFSTYINRSIRHSLRSALLEILGIGRFSFYSAYLNVKEEIEEKYQISLSDHPEFIEEVVDALIKRNIVSSKFREENINRIQLLNTHNINYFDDNDNQVQSNIDSVLVTEYQYLKQAIHSVLETLTSKEKEILILRFGLNGESSKTLEVVSKIFDRSRDRIGQIEKKALRKLRHPWRWQNLRDFCEDEYSIHFNENYLNNTHKELSSTCYDEDYYMFNDIESLEEDIEHTEILESFRKRKMR